MRREDATPHAVAVEQHLDHHPWMIRRPATPFPLVASGDLRHVQLVHHVGYEVGQMVVTSVNGSRKRSHISLRHWSVSALGQRTSIRETSPRCISSRMSSPAIIVLPAPGSSASRKRMRGNGSMRLYTASSWCSKGSTWETDTANWGSKAWAKWVLSASTPRRNSRGSASKVWAPPVTSRTRAASCSLGIVRL